MITATGKTFIKRYLANQSGTVAGALSIGICETAATLNDQRLGFEFTRFPIDIVSYDFTTDRLIFKGSVPAEAEGKIYEIGLWTSEVNTAVGNQGSRLITTFDSATEDWTNETTDTLTTRIGIDSLKHTPSASTTVTSSLGNLTFDFSQYSAVDKFVVAYNVDNANTATIKIRFETDGSNYYEYIITAPTAGYHFTDMLKGTMAVVGTPHWDDIGTVSVLTTATGGGPASVEFDGIRLEDMDTDSVEYGLIARYVPTLPSVKTDGSILDIEFSLDVTV